ncbi:MAG: hypothetical protein IJW46_04570 [Clostridia bacterium]|nr:hypothetical protein [Clostridia bacterium]
MALTSLNFTTKGGRIVRLRLDDGVSVEAYGRYFTLPLGTPLAVSVSDDYLVFVLDKEEDNLSVYTFDGSLAFTLADLGVSETLVGGSLVSASEAVLFLSRYPEADLAPDHTYYLATTRDYRMLWLDLDSRKVFYPK